MYTKIRELQLSGKKVLVAGCGFGDDAFYLARLGAEVYAFDISPDVLEVAETVSRREKLQIRFAHMAAENLHYPNGFFDGVVMRDVLHHVDMPAALTEIVRVGAEGAVAVVNEVYAHSYADRVRHSRLVERWLYRRMQRIVYGSEQPYITEDERKLDERDVDVVLQTMHEPVFMRYFDCLVNRVLPVQYGLVNQADSLLLNGVGSLARYLGGRVLLIGRLKKA